MFKRKISLSFFLAFISAVSFAQVSQVTENQAGISARLQFEIDNTKDPALGYVPKGRLVQAYQFRQDRLRQLAAQNTASLFSWTERGPNSDAVGPSNGNTRPGNGKTSGRVRAIWEDLGDATGKTVWVGGIDGGLWKTNDITVSPATWTPINDFFGNLAVGSICQDPSDVNIMYFGTGEKAINADAVRGAGIWRSTDHGVTWSVMSGTANFWNVSKVVCDASGNLYVGCNSISNTAGLQRYTKSSGTWTNITPSGLDPRVPDIELSSTGRLHVTCGYYNTSAGSAGYRYTDNPATVTSGGWTSPVTSYTPVNINVDLASNGNTLYALPSNSSYQVATIYKSTDGGANWAATGTTPAFTSGQAWYCMAVAIDPSNANNVIVGSLDCYKTTNGGTSWTKISEWVGTTGQYVHADQQIITWRSNNQVLFGCDGGVHYSANGGTTITDRNEGLRIKQFYAVANHPTSTNYFLAGAQDNGVHQLNNAGLGASVEVTGGDGAFVHIDQNEGQYQWGSYVYNQYRRSTNSGSSWSSINYSSSAGKFINPTDYDDVNNIMYCSGNANAFVRWSNPQTGSTFTSVTMSGLNSGRVSAVKVSPYTNHTVFFGGGGSGITPSLIKATAANATPTFTSIIGAGMTTASANISCIELGTDEQNIIVVYSNYGVSNIWVTGNGGTSWTAIDGNLPDMPVRWAMFYPGDNTKAIIATETGVWQTALINGASTTWDPETGFPNVRTDMLQYRASDGLLSAATHGRGLFTTIISAAPSCGTVTGLTTSAITYNSASVSWTALSGALNYDVDYKLNSSGTWINAATATTNLSVALSSLTASSLYDWRVRANCTGASGAYAQAQFTTAAAPTCDAPTGLTTSAITYNSASISWTAVSGAADYDVDYKLNSSGTWINAATATTNLSVALSGLTASSLYDWRVRANCTAVGLNSAYTQAQFTTAAPPTCDAPTGLTTSAITYNSASISWTAVSGAADYDVDYKLNSSGTWINAATATTNLSVALSGLTASSLYDWRVRANCTAVGLNSAYTQDQFTTLDPPTCNAPTGLASSGITATAATVSWTAVSGAADYDVDYKLNSSGTWINAATATTNLSVVLSGLTNTSLYDWRVRANCTAVGLSSTYSLDQFTTNPPPPTCDAPTGLTTSAITYNSATISWTAVSGAADYDVDYKLNSSGTWINAATATTNLSVALSGLTGSSLYDWRVRANCTAVGLNSAYTQAQFTTPPPPTCDAPTGLTTSAITYNSATISWTAVSGAADYDVDYKLNSSGTWINAVTATTNLSVALSGLTASSLYDWRVRANCTAVGLSSAYTQAQFTTAAPPTCDAPTGLASSGITATAATVSWTAVSGAANYDVSYKLNSSGTWITAATATTSLSVALSGLTGSSLYDWRVRANCTAVGLSSSYTQAQFTTLAPPTCNAPTGLTSSAITSSSATVSWTAVSGASNYDADYKLNSSGTWITAATATTSLSVALSGLTASSLYDWRVRANCTAVGLSSAYTQAQFTTTNACPGPLDVSTNGTASGAATIPFNTDVKGLISPTGDNDYYKFVITTGGTATITLTTLPFDYDIKLYRSNGTTQLAVSQNAGTANETITRTYTAGTYYVRVYGYNGANSATSCYTLRVQLGTASVQELPLTEESDLRIKLFPNPVTNKLSIYLVGDNSPKILTLYDMSGKTIYTQQLNDMFTTLDLQRMAKGTYFIKITHPNGKVLYTEKVVKN